MPRADDLLFSVSLSEFAAARKRLEKELRDAGDGEAARRVRERRKPPVTVWAVNQLARQQREEVAELLRLAGEVKRAQAAALAGQGSAFLELGRKLRSEVGRLVGLAGTLAREAGHSTGPSFARRVGATLQAAALDDGETLRDGRLESESSPAAMFAPGVPAPSPKRGEGRSKPAARPPSNERALERERQRQRTAARKAALKKRREATAARTAADRVERQAEEAATRLQSLRRAAVEARRRANDLTRDADAAERALKS
jgi:hypothetical protein